MKSIRLLFLLFITWPHFGLGQEDDKPLDIVVEESKDSVNFLALNHRLYPQTVALQIMTKGVEAPALPDYFVVPPGAKPIKLFAIAIPKGKAWSYRYGYRLSMGNVEAKHNDEIVYQLPFPQGTTYMLSQGYNGKVSHQNINALDFTMEEGDTITAARDGIVVRVKANESRGCPAPRCAEFANYVTVLHDDDTMAEYVHFKQNGVLVAVGEQVMAGTPIGLAGATGQASGPHLHFIVYSQNSETQINFQTKFRISETEVSFLTEGNRYTAHYN